MEIFEKGGLLRWLVAMGLLLSFSAVHAAAGEIELARDLERDGEQVRQSGRPIVALMTASDCEYCAILKKAEFRYLTHDDRFLLREVVIDSDEQAKDFDGSETAHGSLAERYKVKLTPTVLFLDHAGKPLTKPLIGVLTLDYYSYYFDQRVAEATRVLQERLN